MQFGDFDPFVEADLSPPGSAKEIGDPTGLSPEPTVLSFGFDDGYCSNKKYGDGVTSDCSSGSSRSQMREDVFATKKNGQAQPKEAWYTWSVYFPPEFKFGPEQNAGLLSMFYWHNGQCPHLVFYNGNGRVDDMSLGTNRLLSNYDCSPGPQLKIAAMAELIGKWSRFEMFVRWGGDEDGEAKIYLNGNYLLHYKGPTLTPGLEKTNYFVMGPYLCCTTDVKATKGETMYMAAVRRATTRSKLFMEADTDRLRKLQELLNVLGCDVGPADGALGKRTREQALTCRAFDEGQLPGDIGVSNVQKFLELYGSEGAAQLPKGDASRLAIEPVAALEFPADPTKRTDLVPVKFDVRPGETQTHKPGRSVEVNSSIAGPVKDNPNLRSVDFTVLGEYSYQSKNFYSLSIFLEDNIEKDRLQDCPRSYLQFPDKSYHVLVQFQFNDGVWKSMNADCIIAAAPKAQAKMVDFVTSHFADISVGMVRYGGNDLLSNEGLREFFERVAKGEIKVERDN